MAGHRPYEHLLAMPEAVISWRHMPTTPRGPGPVAAVHRIFIVTALLCALAYAAWELREMARTGEALARVRGADGARGAAHADDGRGAELPPRRRCDGGAGAPPLRAVRARGARRGGGRPRRARGEAARPRLFHGHGARRAGFARAPDRRARPRARLRGGARHGLSLRSRPSRPAPELRAARRRPDRLPAARGVLRQRPPP